MTRRTLAFVLAGCAATAVLFTVWAAGSKPPHHKPYVLMVCGKEPTPGGPTGFSYHDCTSHPLQVESEEQCNRYIAMGGWLLSTGPVIRTQFKGKSVILACVAQADLAGAYTDLKKSDTT